VDNLFALDELVESHLDEDGGFSDALPAGDDADVASPEAAFQ